MITVFGASGRVGRATVRYLTASGAQVRAVIHRTTVDAELEAASDVVTADLHDPQAIAMAAAGSDAVQVLCPITPGLVDPIGEAAIIIDALVEGLSMAETPAVVAISDYGAEIPSGAGITTILHQLETRVAELPAQVTFLRSAEHMQNWLRQVPMALQTGVLGSMHHPLTKAFSTVHAPDLGAVAAGLLLQPQTDGQSRRIVYVEGPRRYTAHDVAAAITQISGRQITARELPRQYWGSVLTAAGASASSAQLVTETFDAHNAGRIEAVPGIELRHGNTPLTHSLAPEIPRWSQT